MILFYFIFSVYNKEKVEVKNNMGSKVRALKRCQAGGKRLFQKRRKRFKSSNNDIQSTELCLDAFLAKPFYYIFLHFILEI